MFVVIGQSNYLVLVLLFTNENCPIGLYHRVPVRAVVLLFTLTVKIVVFTSVASKIVTL